mmetsp:Transcript_55336/g.98500  ORF Transcript_55336/g.98500 Transcript_55336/m.98500 type:complete len:85 (-) Transcript_55336:424-678(-)
MCPFLKPPDTTTSTSGLFELEIWNSESAAPAELNVMKKQSFIAAFCITHVTTLVTAHRCSGGPKRLQFKGSLNAYTTTTYAGYT